jgi:hypothetical protein
VENNFIETSLCFAYLHVQSVESYAFVAVIQGVKSTFITQRDHPVA